MTKKIFDNFSKKMRIQILIQSTLKKSGHLGGSLSCVEIINYILNNLIKKNELDKFILSKGHCALALYAALYLKKNISKKNFESFLNVGSYYSEHPSPKIGKNLISFSTGALGHGLSFAAGCAYASKIKGQKSFYYVLLSDGECNSGTVWEAAMLASINKLDNLFAFIDYNKLQATGRSNDIMQLKPLKKKWENFGWKTLEIDGHDYTQIKTAVNKLNKFNNKPKIIIANTIKGKGFKLAENDNNWHYRSPTQDELIKGMEDLKY